ncbi:MAG: DUF4476 domain-containing protein [Bacteroidota bacterium]
MKNFTFLFAVLFSVTFASDASKLSIRLYDNSLFTIVVDAQRYSTPSNNFKFDYLSPGNHVVKIMKIIPGGYGHPAINQLVFKGSINIPSNASVYAKLNHFNKLEITKVINHASTLYGNCNGYGSNGYYSGYNNYYDYGETGCNGYYAENNNFDDYSYGMSLNEFNNLKYTIMNSSFDSSRLTIAKQAISSNGITSEQVFELMMLFSFESNKLDLAKFAYGYTVDRNNYYVVNNAFTFSSSIDDLNDYIMTSSW